MSHQTKIPYEATIKYLPINLKNKAQRELRIQNGGIGKNRVKNRKKRQNLCKRKFNFEHKELQALIKLTENKLKCILNSEPLMSDIPANITIEELEGEIALAEGRATVVYIKRDGLSTLEVALPQEKPTIANLKRAIETKTRIQLKREHDQTDHVKCMRQDTNTTAENRADNIGDKESHLRKIQTKTMKRRLQLRQITEFAPSVSSCASDTSGSNNNNNNNDEETDMFIAAARSAGELVCSATHNGYHHRSNASWRYLWRAYSLYNLNTKQPIKGDNGRQLLSECGIENGTVLKFCKREKYFGRKRQ